MIKVVGADGGGEDLAGIGDVGRLGDEPVGVLGIEQAVEVLNGPGFEVVQGLAVEVEADQIGVVRGG